MPIGYHHLKIRLKILNRKWRETIEILTNKIENLDNLRRLIPDLDIKLNEFWNWLDSAENFFKDSIEFGDFKVMEEQIGQYDALLADIDGEVSRSILIIDEHFDRIKKIVQSCDALLLTSNLSLSELPKADEEQQDNNRQLKEELKRKVNDVIENYNSFKEEANNKRDLLKQSLRECRKIDEKIDNFDKEIENINCEKLMFNEIEQLNERCYNLEIKKERLIKNLTNCTKMKDNLQDLNEKGNFKTIVCLEKMIDKVKAIETKCTIVIDEILALCLDSGQIKIKYDELCKMYNSRGNWLDKLEQIISRSTQELVDSEEISDYIDNLENHLKNKPDDVCLDKVEQLINDLNELYFEANDYVDKQEDRWLTVTAEAGNRDKQLHQMLCETQELEQQLLILQQKLKSIDSILENRINQLNDEDSEDNANEQFNVEHIEDKFKDANQMITFLNEQIHKILAEQRHLAANRFKEQLRFLQINYTELDKKFNELKSTPDENVNVEKDTIIDDLKKVYDDLQNRKLTNSETDLIQQELFKVAQPIPELQNRIQELQKSSHSLTYRFNSTTLASEENTKQSSKASILRSHSDLDLSSPPALTNGLANQYNSDLNTYEEEDNTYESERTPQAIEINLNLDNSDYLNEQEELFEDSVDEPWQRCLTNNYVPYFKNSELKQNFWNHPNMMLLMDDLSELNEIYYAAYRTSIKLRQIQQALFLNCIHITNMCKIFDTFDFRNDNLVTIPEMISIFKNIYEDITIKITPIHNFGLIIDMALNWVLNLYDLGKYFLEIK